MPDALRISCFKDFLDKKNKSDITDVILPEGVEIIGEGAFTECHTLENISLPYSVRMIEGYAFHDCRNLESIDVSINNEYYSSVDGALFNKDQTILIKYPENKGNRTYVIPDSVKEIMPAAFYNCYDLEEVFIPQGVTVINANTFAFSKQLKRITIPDSVTVIDYGAFCHCEGLRRIVIPDSVTTINSEAFSYSMMLEEVTLPDNLQTIEYGAFNYCNSLKDIVIPNSVMKIGEAAFEHCDDLNVTLPDRYSFSDIERIFTDCKNLTVNGVKYAYIRSRFGYDRM